MDNSLNITDNLLKDNQYCKEITKKSAIWLHHTAGGSRPDWTIHGWNTDALGRVGTPYVIGRASSSTSDTSWDGKIIRAFDDKYWAYHLGLKHNNMLLNRGSVGIEICNYGYLKKGNDGRFYNYVNKPVNDSAVVELNEPFRGYKYYERYTDAQLESTRKLILDISNRHEIPIAKGIYTPEWFEFDTKWFSLGGLRTHTQVRQDKFDCFPQIELIQMLNSL